MNIDKSLHRIIFLFLFFLSSIYLLHEIGTDSDIWLHLKTGQYIIQHHQIPTKDIFSYTLAGTKWVNHEWLYQITVYLFYSLFGPNGIILLRFLILIGVGFILYKLVNANNNYVLSAVGMLLFLLVLKDRLNDRPEMLTLLFSIFFILILEKYFETKSIWLIPFAQWIWANAHGYFIIGLVITFAYGAQKILENQQNLKKTLRLCFLSIIVSFINPNRPQGFLYPFKMLIEIRGESKIFTNYINELLSPFAIPSNLAFNYLLIYKIIIALSIISLLLNWRKIKIAQITILGVTLLLSLFAIRNIPLFALVGTCFFIMNFPNWGGRIAKNIQVIVSLLIILILAGLSIKEANAKYYVFDKAVYKSKLFGVAPLRYPIKAAEFLKENKIDGNLFNNFFCGSYLIWKLYPEKKVFIDGRTELYGPDLYKYYRNALEDEEVFKNLLSKYEINTIVFFDPAKEPQQSISWLLKSSDWKIVYFDDMSIILVKDNIRNHSVIARYGISLKEIQSMQPISLKIEKGDIYPYRYLNRGKLFAIAGLFDKAEKEAKMAISINNKEPSAYNLLGAIYLSKNNFNAAIDIFKEAINTGLKDENIHYNLGIAYANTNKLDMAIEEYKKALRINPKSQKAAFGLAISYERDGEIDKSKNILTKLYDKDLSGDLNCELGYIYLKERKLDDAKKIFERALKINPNHARSYNGMGLVCAHKNLNSEAEKYFKNAVYLAPNFKEAYDNLGVLYAQRGDYNQAITQWRKALQIDPNFKSAKEKLERTEKVLYSHSTE